MKQAIIILLMVFSLNAWPQSYPPKETPELEFALQLKVTLGEDFSIDNKMFPIDSLFYNNLLVFSLTQSIANLFKIA